MSCIYLVNLIVLFSVLLPAGQFQELSCQLPDRSNGVCVVASQCEFFVQNQEVLLPDTFEELKKREQACSSLSSRHICCESSSQEGTVMKFSGMSQVENKLDLFDLKTCGSVSQNRISNGEDTELGEFPWMAVLRYWFGGRMENGCGGSLINENYVLTAAHCIRVPNWKLVEVWLGDHNLLTDPDCEEDDDGEVICVDPIQKVRIAREIPHPGYNSARRINDIGLIRLAQPARINQNNIKPICLPFTKELQASVPHKLIVSGFGFTDKIENHQNERPVIMQKAILPYYPLDQCQQKFRRMRVQLDESLFCAGGEGRTDTCKGDSGGPAQFPGTLNSYPLPRMIQYGIVAFGVRGCGALAGFPGIYTNVSYFMDFILESVEP